MGWRRRGDAPQVLPVGAELRLAPSRVPATAGVLAELRRIVAATEGLAALYPVRVATADRGEREALAVQPDEEATATDVLETTSAALEPVVGGRELTLFAVGGDLLLSVLGVAAPIGAGGDLERAVAELRTGAPDAAGDLADVLATGRVLVPADGPAPPVPAPEQLASHEGPWVVTEVASGLVVPLFSSWWALLHADPPWPRQLDVAGADLLRTLPPTVGLAVDLGTVHEAVLDPASVQALRERSGVGGA